MISSRRLSKMVKYMRIWPIRIPLWTWKERGKLTRAMTDITCWSPPTFQHISPSNATSKARTSHGTKWATEANWLSPSALKVCYFYYIENNAPTRLIGKNFAEKCKAYQIITETQTYAEAAEKCESLSADLLGSTLNDLDYKRLVC